MSMEVPIIRPGVASSPTEEKRLKVLRGLVASQKKTPGIKPKQKKKKKLVLPPGY